MNSIVIAGLILCLVGCIGAYSNNSNEETYAVAKTLASPPKKSSPLVSIAKEEYTASVSGSAAAESPAPLPIQMEAIKKESPTWRSSSYKKGWHSPESRGSVAARENLGIALLKGNNSKKAVRSFASTAHPPDNEPAGAPESISQRIDAFFNSLKTAAYTFNPPSPIKVAEPVTVHFWLDPQATAAELAEELKKAVPLDAARVESGLSKWSPKMRATLSGQNFEVKAIDPEEQVVGATLRTTWSWDITPLNFGKNLALHLRLEALPPPEIGSTKTITTIDREIRVEVTWWWLFDHYYEKYWKELLAGLGTALASLVAWWWKKRQ
ncbi:MAG: hypothetical protein PHX38_11565 [Sulfuricella sp.]|nr:hypothetical protein [Sulfuricella sp.]